MTVGMPVCACAEGGKKADTRIKAMLSRAISHLRLSAIAWRQKSSNLYSKSLMANVRNWGGSRPRSNIDSGHSSGKPGTSAVAPSRHAPGGRLSAQVLPSSQCPLASAGREAGSHRILHKITCPAGPVRPTLNAARHLRAQKRSFEVFDTKPGSRRSNPGSSNSKRVHRKNASYKGRWAISG